MAKQASKAGAVGTRFNFLLACAGLVWTQCDLGSTNQFIPRQNIRDARARAHCYGRV